MSYIGHEPERGTVKYRCPAKHEGWECPMSATCNAGKSYGKTVRAPEATDPRRSPALPRATKKFERATRSRIANPETAPIAVEIFRMSVEGLTVVEIAAELNRRGIPCPSAYRNQRFKDGAPRLWNATCVIQIIKDRTYLGQAIARKFMPTGQRLPNGKCKMAPRPEDQQVLLSDGRTDQLVEPELFEAANQALKSRRRSYRAKQKKLSHLLAGFIWCAACGSRMSPQSPGGK
jgi:hypothetical protein